MTKLYLSTLVLLAFSILISCKPTNNTNLKQPKAKQIAKELVMHGDARIDNYYWLIVLILLADENLISILGIL